MSDLKIHEFRQRAERGLALPDLADIERRGRALRRRRVAAAVGGLALLLVAASGIATLATDRTDGTLPATPVAPTPTVPDEMRVETRYDGGEEVLEPGPAQVSMGRTSVGFDVGDDDWEWWGVGFGMRSDADRDQYTAAVFFMPSPSARLEPCRDDRARRLGSDPGDLVGNVSPLLGLAHSRVLQRPRVVTAFGGTAVHLRIETAGVCSSYGELPAQLRGVHGASNFDPGWEGRHELDLWHLVAPEGEQRAAMLVAVWDLDGVEGHSAEVQGLLESIEIEIDDD